MTQEECRQLAGTSVVEAEARKYQQVGTEAIMRIHRKPRNEFLFEFVDIIQMLFFEICAALVLIFVLPIVLVIFQRKHITKAIGFTLV